MILESDRAPSTTRLAFGYLLHRDGTKSLYNPDTTSCAAALRLLVCLINSDHGPFSVHGYSYGMSKAAFRTEDQGAREDQSMIRPAHSNFVPLRGE